MAISDDFRTHLATGATSTCRCWSVTRKDGAVLGFTDHDQDLSFDGIAFAADSGMSARSLEQTTGLSVDNSEALGVLSHASVNEADVLAGRYDGAEVKAWLVNWDDVEQRKVLFLGTIGEIQREGGAFQAELRGLTEKLNQVQGLVFQKSCSAVLGDGNCGFDLDQTGYTATVPAEGVKRGKFYNLTSLGGFDDRWFERGRIIVQTGPASGLIGLIKNDRLGAMDRVIELWSDLRAPVAAGDILRIEPGCDKRSDTCRLKFNNLLNFRGFPGIPGDDWLVSVPRRGGANNGGSLSS